MKENLTVLDIIDNFNDDIQLLDRLEADFFEEKVKVQKIVETYQKIEKKIIGSPASDYYHKLMEVGYELMFHALNYKQYQNLMKNLVQIDNDFLYQLHSLSLMTNKLTKKYQLVKKHLLTLENNLNQMPQRSSN